MRHACGATNHRRAPLPPIGVVALLGLAGWTLGGCSSPSRGPETDIVEVERIEVLPTETDAPPADSGGEPEKPAVAGPTADGTLDAEHPAAEEVPPRPAAD